MRTRIKRLPEKATKAQCLEFLRDLANQNLDFHLEDSPAEIVHTCDNLPTFNHLEVTILDHNVEQCYRVIKSVSRCPIYWLMKYADERDKKGGR